ncbi:Uncharacterized membrane-anchored protein [Alteribacillus persepolensis]|uniref:Uncharacterized membrane-anchored protein n=1 Tax=Alteribacillus persepolensis TaxID=568899 RepID=A0A1G8D1M6_9BACI|nr:putative cytokinetic ring protein SteA [Alteribacillus persepolensis]SDH51665.1 Uncharacterized membrane-anchored protein [Alteribacillus persepolensis]
MSTLKGKAYFHEKTKTLAQHIPRQQIAVIKHEDIDPIAADSLIQKRVKAVVNLKQSMSGAFFHEGVKRLLEHGVRVFDVKNSSNAGPWLENRDVFIEHDVLYADYGGKKYVVGELKEYDLSFVKLLEEKGRGNLALRFEQFGTNSISYAKEDLSHLLECWSNWEEGSAFRNQDVLIVIRGTDYEKDLDCIQRYFAHKTGNTVLIAVDGAANTMVEKGLPPDYIIGDMDSVASDILHSGAQLIVHEGMKGNSPGMKRVKEHQLRADTVRFIGLSEDAAMAFALKQGAKRIYLVGGHRDMEEYLSKGRKGMGSSLLMKMLAGSKIVDLKGIHYFYQHTGKSSALLWQLKKIYYSLPFLRSAKSGKEVREIKA